MKTMNYLLTIAFLFVAASCTKETPVDNEELESSEFMSRMDREQEQEDTQEVFKIDLHQSYVLGQIAMLNQQKRELEEEIEEGNEKQIPILESVMDQIKINTEILRSILENTCAFLKMRKMALQIRVFNGDESVKDELEHVKKKLENCGEDADDYANKQELSIYAIHHPLPRPKELGVCIPKDEYSCSVEFNSGNLLINRIQIGGSNPEIYFKTTKGQVIIEGKNLGSHSELEGVEQTVVKLSEIEIGILEFADKKAPFRQPVTVK